MSLTLVEIENLFTAHGAELYGGEAVSQREHALQAAYLAEQAGEDDELIIACLLHDLGHLVFKQGNQDLAQGIDDLHQYKIVPFLRHLLPDSVVEPIALHVDAKRYLCFAEAGYFEQLSEASRLSLALQGGAMKKDSAGAFSSRPHADRAIALRRYDDAAKVVGMKTPDLGHFWPRLESLAKRDEA